MHLDGFEQRDICSDDVENPRFSELCTGKKKRNEENIKEKISVSKVHTIGDCELRSLLTIEETLTKYK